MTPANVRRVLLLLFIALVGLGVYVANRSENTTTSRKVTLIEAASPCLTYPKSDLCKESFEKAVLTITHAEACAIERKAGTLRAIRELAARLGVTFTEPCAGARLAQERQRGKEREATSRRAHRAELAGSELAGSERPPTVPGGGSTGIAGWPPKGGSTHPLAPDKGGSNDGRHPAAGGEVQSELAPEPSPEASTNSPAPEEGAGNSGETPAAQNAVGVKACVEIAVSACAGVGLPEPHRP